MAAQMPVEAPVGPPAPMEPPMPSDPSQNVLEWLSEQTEPEKDWTSLPIKQKHLDERVVEILLEQFEDDLETLINFIDVGDRPAFHMVPSDGELVAMWQDESTRQKMIADAMEGGGPKAVSELIDKVQQKEQSFWRRMSDADMYVEGG